MAVIEEQRASGLPLRQVSSGLEHLDGLMLELCTDHQELRRELQLSSPLGVSQEPPSGSAWADAYTADDYAFERERKRRRF